MVFRSGPVAVEGACERYGQQEFAARARPIARRRYFTAVRMHQSTRQREPDAEPSLRAFQSGVHLAEHFEYLCEMFPGDANAIVLDADLELCVTLGHGELDAAAGIGIFRRVDQQIGYHLRQPYQIP